LFKGDIQDLIYIPFPEGAKDVCRYYSPECGQDYFTISTGESDQGFVDQSVAAVTGEGGAEVAGSMEGGEVVMVDKSGMGGGAQGVVMVDKSSMGAGAGAGGVMMVDKSGAMQVLDKSTSGGILIDAKTGEAVGKVGGSMIVGKEGAPVSTYHCNAFI
jgi:hypothetical protein